MVVHVSDPRVLDNSLCTTQQGNKFCGSPSHSKHSPDQNPEAGFQKTEAIRQRLLQALGGCQNSLHLLLRIFDGPVSYGQLAAELGMSRGGAHRRVRSVLTDIQATWIVQEARSILLGGTPACTIGFDAQPVGAIDAYGVSMYKTERRFKEVPSEETLKKYVKRQKVILDRAGHHFLGAYHDTDLHLWCVDVTVLVNHDQSFAEALERINQQRSIFCFKTGECIALPIPKASGEPSFAVPPVG